MKPRHGPHRTGDITACIGQDAARVTGTAENGGPVIIRDTNRAAIGQGPTGQGGGYDPRRKEEEQSGQESRSGGFGGRGRLTSCGWRPSAIGEEVTAVSGVRLHKGARPERLPDLSGQKGWIWSTQSSCVCSACNILRA